MTTITNGNNGFAFEETRKSFVKFNEIDEVKVNCEALIIYFKNGNIRTYVFASKRECLNAFMDIVDKLREIYEIERFSYPDRIKVKCKKRFIQAGNSYLCGWIVNKSSAKLAPTVIEINEIVSFSRVFSCSMQIGLKDGTTVNWVFTDDEAIEKMIEKLRKI